LIANAVFRRETERKLRRELDTVLAHSHHLSQAAALDRSAVKSLDLAGDPVDNAQAVESREFSQLSCARLTARAKRLRAALVRAQKGEYGSCDECGDAIPLVCLRAIVDVTTCVHCQELLERAA